MAAATLLTAACSQGAPAQPPSKATPVNVTVTGQTTYQTIAGFGVSEAFGQATTVKDAPPKARKRVLDDLFSDTAGAGLTILRNGVSADPGKTIEPAAPPSPTAAPKYLPLSAIGGDQDQLWLAQQIKADYGVTNVFADSWSAPGFMKVTGSPHDGGALCGAPGATCKSGDWRQAYANYLEQYAADYAKAGVPLTYIGPVNEPDFTPNGYDGMTLTPAQILPFLDLFEQTMARSGLPTKVDCCAAAEWDTTQDYATAIAGDKAASAGTPVITGHGYQVPADQPLTGGNAQTWQTEWSTFEAWDPAWDDGTDASGLSWAQHIFTALDTAHVNAFLYWWGTSTPSYNGDNESLIQLDGDTVTPSARLWAFANFSRFIRPGAVRAAATTPDSDLTVSAFKNADKSAAVVALNTSTRPATVTVTLKDLGAPNGATVTPYLTNDNAATAPQAKLHVSAGSFTWTIPPRSLVTFQVPAA